MHQKGEQLCYFPKPHDTSVYYTPAVKLVEKFLQIKS